MTIRFWFLAPKITCHGTQMWITTTSRSKPAIGSYDSKQLSCYVLRSRNCAGTIDESFEHVSKHWLLPFEIPWLRMSLRSPFPRLQFLVFALCCGSQICRPWSKRWEKLRWLLVLRSLICATRTSLVFWCPISAISIHIFQSYKPQNLKLWNGLKW